MTPPLTLSPCLTAPTPLSVVSQALEPQGSSGHVNHPASSTPLQLLNELAETKIRMALYRDEMVLARNAEGRVRSQRDQYKALRNTAIEEKSSLERQLAATEALLQEQREGDAKAKADFVAEIQHLRESLRAAESDRDGYSQSLKTTQEEAEKARHCWAGEKKESGEALLAAQLACKMAEVGRNGMASQLMVTLLDQGDVEQDLAALQEEANYLRRSLANVKEEAKKALEMRKNELDNVYLDQETLLRARDDLTVELTASRMEVDDLRRSLSDAKDQERHKMEALKRSQEDFNDREEKLATAATALRASLAKGKAVQNQTKKNFVDALGAKELLDEKVKASKASLVRAEETQTEAADEFLRVLTNAREEHEKTFVSLRKTHPAERRLSLAETTRLRLSLDNASKHTEELQSDSGDERKGKTSSLERRADGDELKIGRATRNKLKRRLADALAADKVPLRKWHQPGKTNPYSYLGLSFKSTYSPEANPRPAKVRRHD